MSNGWDLNEGSLRCIAGDAVVTVRVPGRAIIPAPAQLAPSRFCLHEWREVIVRGPAPLRVRFGNQQADQVDHDLVRFTYENQVGRSVIQVQVGGKPLPALPVEVLSPKRPTPAEHLAFYRALVDDLTARMALLPFSVAAPTGIPTAESPRPPSPLFIYHFLRQRSQALRSALTAIMSEPHRVLAEEEVLVPLVQVTDVDADVMLRILTQPEYLVRLQSPAVVMVGSEGYAPTHVWQRLGRETFDTLENRFVLAFMRTLLHWTEVLSASPWLWERVPASTKKDLRDLAGHLRLTLTDPLFDEVGEMAVFPAASQVLLRRYGYRELLDLWRLFNRSRGLFDSIQAAIDARDIATLYEFWCFFALAERIGAALGALPHWRLETSDEHGLKPQSSILYTGSPYRLLYNRGFDQRADRTGSYSVRLRPDFTLIRDKRIIVAFDAKFRLETTTWAGEDDDAADRQARRADLYKMHTYRDALGARAAGAVYPGSEAEFYDALIHRRLEDVTIDKMLTEEWTGVGALPLSPDDSLQS